MEEMLKVRMFGKAGVLYKESPILFSKNIVTKAEKLLLILFYAGREGVKRNKLLEYLYGDEEVLDAANNLRVTCHRLKKLLVEAGLPEHDYIVMHSSVYRWESPMETEIDVFLFRDLIRRAEETENKAEKAALLKRACEMYSGEFLENLSGEEWVLMEGVRYKEMYTDALSQVCEYLKECQEYEEILRLCGPACRMYPFDEWQAVRMECYISLNRYKDAIKEYEDTSKLYFEELGIRPSKRMAQQIKSMEERMNFAPCVIGSIKEVLKEEQIDDGAFYCSLPSFRDEYRLVRRMMERYGQSIYLMLCDITDGKGHLMEDSGKLSVLSERLHKAIKHCLRRCDSFTSINPMQYLVLLVGTNGEDCEVASRRIADYFSREHSSWERYLKFYITSLGDVENEETQICID